MKKIKIKAISIALLVSLSMLSTVVAAATADNVNVMYSGRFEATYKSYFTITEDDCVLTKVKYLDDGDTRYLNASNATSVYLDENRFCVTYNNGILTNYDGTKTQPRNTKIFIETVDVDIAKNFFGLPQQVKVTYNNLIYMHDL